MALISFDKDTIIEYMPEFGGNRESENPCVVRLKFVSNAKAQYYTSLVRAKAKRNLNDLALVTEALQDVQKKQFIEHVESVSGYTLSSGKEVTTAEEFYETADRLLVEEVLKAMESSAKLSEAQRKNS